MAAFHAEERGDLAAHRHGDLEHRAIKLRALEPGEPWLEPVRVLPDHRQVACLSAKGALLIDLREAKTDPKLGALNVQGARLTYLDRGDRFDLGLHRIQPSARKLRGQRLLPGAPDYKPEFLREAYYTDMLGDSTIVNAMAELIDSKQSEARGLAFDPKSSPHEGVSDMGFAFRLYKGKDSIGWYSDELGGEEYTVANLYLDIQPVRIARPMFTPWTPR